MEPSFSTSAPEAKKESLAGRVVHSVASLYERRWLIWYFVLRQLSQSYRGSFLGMFWIFLGPLLMIILYTLVFSKIVGIRFQEAEGIANYGLYLYCGLIPFLAYSGTVNKAVSVIRQNSALVRKVVFPLEVLPLSAAAANVIDQIFGFGALLVLMAILGQDLQWTTFLLPLVMIPQLLFNLGLGYLGAIVGTYVPDVQETLRAVVRATFFVTPIIWPAEMAEDKNLGWVVDYNPIAILVEAYRDLILEGTLPDLTQGMWFTLLSTVMCVAAFVLFLRIKNHFADLI